MKAAFIQFEVLRPPTPWLASTLLHAGVAGLLLAVSFPADRTKSPARATPIYLMALPVEPTTPLSPPKAIAPLRHFVPRPQLPSPLSGPAPTEPVPRMAAIRRTEAPAPKIELPPPPGAAPSETDMREMSWTAPAPPPVHSLRTGEFGAVAVVQPEVPSLAVAVGSFAGAAPRRETALSRGQTLDAGFGSGTAVPGDALRHVVARAPGGFAAAQAAVQPPQREEARSGDFGHPELPAAPLTAKVAPVGAGFGAVAQATRPRSVAVVAPAAVRTALDIQLKPKPEYTAEARRLNIEGEVVLEVLLGADGKARVIRVVTGLGHGLDESARHAALAIAFRPSLSGGRPVDTRAVVRIAFQLAY